MQRKEAEKLLAALIFDDLDEASKTELLNYLQTDNELRERLADMRMAAKVASDTVKHGPDPVLGRRRLKHLAKLAGHKSSWRTFFTTPRLAAAAAIFIIGIVGLAVLLPSLERASERGIPLASTWAKIEADYDERGERGSTSTWARSQIPTVTPSESPGKQTPEATSTRGQFALGSGARHPEVVDRGYAYDPAARRPEVLERRYVFDPAVRGPASVDSGAVAGLPETGTGLAFQNGRRDFRVDDFEAYKSAQTPSLDGYAHLPPKPDSVEKWARGSSFEGKPQSGVTIDGGDGLYSSYNGSADVINRIISQSAGGGYAPGYKVDQGGGDGSYDVDGYRGWWTRDHGAGYGGGHGVDKGGGMMGGYGDKNGDGIMSYPYPPGGFGGMGGFGGAYSSSGEGGGGIMAPSPGSGYYGMGGYGGYGGGAYGDYSHVWRGFDMGKDDSYGHARYSSRGGDSGSGVDGSGGFVSDDTITVTGGTYNGDKDSGGKEINLFNKPDATGIVADGIPATGNYILQNGEATGFKLSGPTDSRENVLHIDDFTTADNDGAPSTVTVVAGKPVTITAPELTPPIPLEPAKDVSGITELPDIKLRTESTELHLKAEDIKTNEWWAEMRAFDHEEVLRKKNEELAKKSHRLAPEKIQTVKPYVPDYDYVKALEGGREGDISKELEELTHERDEKSVSSSEKTIPELLESAGGDKTQLDIIDSDFRASVGETAGKEEHGEGKVPVLGDIPLVGGLFRTEKERQLTEEEKKRIVAYLEQRKSQPEGEPVDPGFEAIKLKYANPQEVENIVDCDFRDLSGAKFLPDFSIESLPQDKQIIIFGRKEQREAVRNMIREIDVPPGQSGVDRTGALVGEDEPDLPPASRFKIVPVNPWVMAERDSLSTFALDVDTASYTLCRRYIRGGFLPPAGAVRMEEFINYFNYHYPQRTNPTFAVHAEAAPSPFARREQDLTLLKIGVKARTIGRDQRKAAHLIFVVDASASMDQPDRLPLVQRALSLLVNKLSAVDRVSLITCANEAHLHLETVPAGERERIRQAINAIQPAGPTNLLAGLKLGYATARRSFAPKQINHVVLCSDGVANVGQTEAEAVLNEVAADRKQGITITCVGVGYGSYNDAFLEALANQGDGSYMFLDSLRQVHRVFVRQLAATLQTVARDARIQVDFNPNRVRRYRLIGYENRDIEDKRFRDDTIDAGEVGSGQCSTALYELELIGRPSADRQEDLGTVFVRYRNVATGQFEEISSRLGSAIVRRLTVESAPRFFLAAGAARFAEILRQSEHAQDGNLMDVFRVVEQVSLVLPLDRDVRELAELIRKSENLPRSP